MAGRGRSPVRPFSLADRGGGLPEKTNARSKYSAARPERSTRHAAGPERVRAVDPVRRVVVEVGDRPRDRRAGEDPGAQSSHLLLDPAQFGPTPLVRPDEVEVGPVEVARPGRVALHHRPVDAVQLALWGGYTRNLGAADPILVYSNKVGGTDVTVRGAEVKFSPREYALLRLLVREAGRVLTHQHLLREVWRVLAPNGRLLAVVPTLKLEFVVKIWPPARFVIEPS